jgi:hypothetical protein
MLLHDLLLTWHQKQQQVQCTDASKTAADSIACLQHDTTGNGLPTAAFLLLLQHLTMFYSLEADRFQQQLQNAVHRSSATPTGDSVFCGSKMLRNTNDQQQEAHAGPKRQQNDYMQAEEVQQCITAATCQYVDRLLHDTAPACYVPLLLQLVREQEIPVYLQVMHHTGGPFAGQHIAVAWFFCLAGTLQTAAAVSNSDTFAHDIDFWPYQKLASSLFHTWL